MKSKRQIAINNKRRGKRLEADVVDAAEAADLTARRAWGSDGRALGEHEEVDVMIGNLKFQCKMKKKLPSWLLNHESLDGSIIRMDNCQPLVVYPLSLFLQYYKAFQLQFPGVNTNEDA